MKEDQVVRITVPIELSLRLGSPEGAQPGQEPRPNEVASEELSRLLGEVRRASSRPYYEEAEDRADLDRYYGGIALRELRGAELFDALGALVRDTHARWLGYSPSQRLYPWVDRQPDRSIKSLYTDETFAQSGDVEEFIRSEFLKEQAVRTAVSELRTHEGLMGAEALGLEADRLEAAAGFNCEHVVPQSWFQKRSPMRGDLHHLFACETECNRIRGNTPYYDFPDFEERVFTGCGKSEPNDLKFEPAHGKGPAARATLYFLLRYPGEVGDAAREMQRDRLPVVLEWARLPVTLHERHRNAAIFEAQGNRNPFVDFPDLGDRIDLTGAFGGA